MMHTYQVSGMTCGNCKATVTEKLSQISGVLSVDVDLQKKEAHLSMDRQIDLAELQRALPDRYKISSLDTIPTPVDQSEVDSPSKLSQLKPLFLILGYIAVASVLLHRDTWDMHEMMIDFMGLFFIVFSFFKMLDLKGFATTFSMYDPIAKRLPIYSRIYPFIETVLGLMLLLRIEIIPALVATIVILGLTTIGVTQTLLAKRPIQCACLGTALNLPMTEATFVENAIMIIMSIVMIIS